MKTVGLVLLGALAGLFAAGLILLAASPPRGEAVVLLPLPSPVPLVVDVRGEVLRPGVYQFPPGSRLEDAIQAAGGFTLKAVRTEMNLAALLLDGQQIIVPAQSSGRVIGDPNPGSDAPALPGELININTATLEELDSLPGIGPVLAQSIIDYRTDNGDFLALEEIMNVSGIGQATFDAMQGLITVGE
jgi:competence protein ComEA